MIRVYVARQRFDAYLVADRLNQAGIRAHVFNEHMSSIAGDVPLDGQAGSLMQIKFVTYKP